MLSKTWKFSKDSKRQKLKEFMQNSGKTIDNLIFFDNPFNLIRHHKKIFMLWKWLHLFAIFKKI